MRAHEDERTLCTRARAWCMRAHERTWGCVHVWGGARGLVMRAVSASSWPHHARQCQWKWEGLGRG
eukprot:2468743-Alexandrium_andersonii.AAC.1